MPLSLTSTIALCNQRKQQQLLNIPPSRIETVSPYENSKVTKFELDMRRKAEVLLYNQGNTKTNPLTKNQKWAQVVNGKSPPVSKSFLNPTKESDSYQVLKNWNNKINIPTASSACNVPNDYINNVNQLVYDPSIVLYNYINPVLTRSYGILNPALDTSVIRYMNYKDINTNISSNYISIVEFTDLADDGYYTLSLNNIPLAFQISGDVSINGSGANTGDIKISGYKLNIYYNSKLVTSTDPIFNLYPSSTYTINIPSSKVDTFSGIFFIGYLDITNIIIYGTPGYVYNFQLIINFNTNDDYSDNSNTYHLINIAESFIANVSAISISKHNCDISFTGITPTINTLGSFTITAV